MEFIDDPGVQVACESRVRIIGSDKISLTLFQGVGTFNGSVVDHFDMNVGVFFVELFSVGYQIVAADGVAGANTQLASV